MSNQKNGLSLKTNHYYKILDKLAQIRETHCTCDLLTSSSGTLTSTTVPAFAYNPVDFHMYSSFGRLSSQYSSNFSKEQNYKKYAIF